jgi:hypothetical protein
LDLGHNRQILLPSGFVLLKTRHFRSKSRFRAAGWSPFMN